MKKPFVALLLLTGAAAMLATSAFAQSDDVGLKLKNAKMVKELMRSRASNLGVSAGPDPDTVYVGKSYTNHTAPDNYWNIYVGDYLPTTNTATYAFWDWDNSVGIQAADSLHGWWPAHRQYNSTGGLTLTDNLVRGGRSTTATSATTSSASTRPRSARSVWWATGTRTRASR